MTEIFLMVIAYINLWYFILKYKLDQDKSVKEKNTLKIQYLILNFVIPMLWFQRSQLSEFTLKTPFSPHLELKALRHGDLIGDNVSELTFSRETQKAHKWLFSMPSCHL